MAAPRSSTFVLALLVLAPPSPADASSFLNRAHDQRTLEAKALRGGRAVEVQLDAQFEKGILAEIEGVLGAEHRQDTERRLARIEEMLRSTFTSLEKNVHKNLDHASVRYALHRYFLQRHSWSVKGLAAGGEAWNSASPADVLQGRVDDLVQSLFENRLGKRGLNLHEVAVLAATMENLIHQETLENFNTTRASLELETEALSVDEVDKLLDLYMLSYITGSGFEFSGQAAVEARLSRAVSIYSQWAETQRFVRDIRSQTLDGSKESFTFTDAVTVVEAVADRWGHFQDEECRDLKKALGQLEERGAMGAAPSGRVALSEFYGSAVRGENWQFSENIEYLRQIGALDETEASRPKVISTNYIHAPSNCIAASKFYEVCCTDECEGLMDHIEHRVAAPTATPEALLEVVAAMPSATMAAGRSISPTLAGRLREIAATHGGRVPLHGRLFAQWMHHAYPRECRFPHLAGSTRPGDLGYVQQNVHVVQATHAEMQRVIDAAEESGAAAGSASLEVAPWHHEEELLGELPSAKSGSGSRTFGRGLVLLALVVSTGATLLRTAKAHLGSGSKKGHGTNCLKDHFL